MNLYNLTNIIKDICKSQPNVAQVEVGDVYAINHKQDIEYPAMVVTQQTSFVDNINKTTTYNFTIFYIDLLDSDESNMLDVQSIATVALNDVMEAIEGAGILLSDTYEKNTFRERFNDVCAGAFVRVGIIVDNETCEGEDYNLVYSVNGESGDVWLEFPDVSNYYTKSEVNSLVDSATSGLPTPQEFNEMEEELEGKADSTALTSVYQSLTSHTSDSSIHLTSGAVQTQINNAITSATTNMQTTTNMTQSITSGSTTTQYPSASAVYGVIPKFEVNDGVLNIIVP